MLFNINKNIILEEMTTERKLTRIPILTAAGAILHPIIGTGIDLALGKDNVLNVDNIEDKAMLGAGVGTLMGGINYFRKDGGLGPTSLISQTLYPIKK